MKIAWDQLDLLADELKIIGAPSLAVKMSEGRDATHYSGGKLRLAYCINSIVLVTMFPIGMFLFGMHLT